MVILVGFSAESPLVIKRVACNPPLFLLIPMFVFLLASPLLAQQTAVPRWVPFSARQVQHIRGQAGGAIIDAEVSGVFVRDGHGSIYRRMTPRSHSPLLLYGDDIAELFDRPNNVSYWINYTKKTVKVQNGRPGVQPHAGELLIRETFDQFHAGQESLGQRTIEGYECEGYRVPDPSWKKHFAEVWYAPALNFLALLAKTQLRSGHEVTVQVTEMHAGKEPDPGYFRVPPDFKTHR
jgi:hypothetical protein